MFGLSGKWCVGISFPGELFIDNTVFSRKMVIASPEIFRGPVKTERK
jgi:hypothetical protein